MEAPVIAVDELWNRWFARSNIVDRNALFEYYFPWCRRIASSLYLKYHHELLEWRDFVHSASEAMLTSIELYQNNRNVPFEAYAYKRLKGEILKSIRSYTKDKQLSAADKNQQLMNERMNVDADEDDPFKVIVDAAIGLAFGFFLEAGIIEHTENKDSPQNVYETSRISNKLIDLVEKLDENKRFVVKAHYYQQLSFSEIADVLDVSKARVSQVHSGAIKELKIMFDG